MADDKPAKPSFSAARRFGVVLNAFLSLFTMLALVVMVNYLASGYYKRLSLAQNSRFGLSSQTIKVLQSVTNDIAVTVFFAVHGEHQEQELYDWVSGLLKEYRNLNPRIKVKTVDYTRFPGEAALVLSKYKLDLKDKDFVLFESEGRTKVHYKNELADLDLQPLIRGETREVRRTAFRGEMLFTSAIFSITHPRPLKAYFLKGHGEHDPGDSNSEYGYAKFASVLKDENNVAWTELILHGTNEIPADCQLLIIAGPGKGKFANNELDAIGNYLGKGGRLFVLLNNWVLGGNSGIEKLLEKWGVAVGNNVVFDPENSISTSALIPAEINPEHAVTRTLFQEHLQIELALPRSIDAVSDLPSGPTRPQVHLLFRTGTNALARSEVRGTTSSGRDKVGSFPLMAAVETGNIKGVTAERGATRIIVIGDSLCLNNQLLNAAANHYFAGFAINWLLAQPAYLLEGLGPKPVQSYRLNMTLSESRTVRWLFLAGMPGAILALGGLVWFRRRS